MSCHEGKSLLNDIITSVIDGASKSTDQQFLDFLADQSHIYKDNMSFVDASRQSAIMVWDAANNIFYWSINFVVDNPVFVAKAIESMKTWKNSLFNKSIANWFAYALENFEKLKWGAAILWDEKAVWESLNRLAAMMFYEAEKLNLWINRIFWSVQDIDELITKYNSDKEFGLINDVKEHITKSLDGKSVAEKEAYVDKILNRIFSVWVSDDFVKSLVSSKKFADDFPSSISKIVAYGMLWMGTVNFSVVARLARFVDEILEDKLSINSEDDYYAFLARKLPRRKWLSVNDHIEALRFALSERQASTVSEWFVIDNIESIKYRNNIQYTNSELQSNVIADQIKWSSTIVPVRDIAWVFGLSNERIDLILWAKSQIEALSDDKDVLAIYDTIKKQIYKDYIDISWSIDSDIYKFIQANKPKYIGEISNQIRENGLEASVRKSLISNITAWKLKVSWKKKRPIILVENDIAIDTADGKLYDALYQQNSVDSWFSAVKASWSDLMSIIEQHKGSTLVLSSYQKLPREVERKAKQLDVKLVMPIIGYRFGISADRLTVNAPSASRLSKLFAGLDQVFDRVLQTGLPEQETQKLINEVVSIRYPKVQSDMNAWLSVTPANFYDIQKTADVVEYTSQLRQWTVDKEEALSSIKWVLRSWDASSLLLSLADKLASDIFHFGWIPQQSIAWLVESMTTKIEKDIAGKIYSYIYESDPAPLAQLLLWVDVSAVQAFNKTDYRAMEYLADSIGKSLSIPYWSYGLSEIVDFVVANEWYMPKFLNKLSDFVADAKEWRATKAQYQEILLDVSNTIGESWKYQMLATVNAFAAANPTVVASMERKNLQYDYRSALLLQKVVWTAYEAIRDSKTSGVWKSSPVSWVINEWALRTLWLSNRYIDLDWASDSLFEQFDAVLADGNMPTRYKQIQYGLEEAGNKIESLIDDYYRASKWLSWISAQEVNSEYRSKLRSELQSLVNEYGDLFSTIKIASSTQPTIQTVLAKESLLKVPSFWNEQQLSADAKQNIKSWFEGISTAIEQRANNPKSDIIKNLLENGYTTIPFRGKIYKFDIDTAIRYYANKLWDAAPIRDIPNELKNLPFETKQYILWSLLVVLDKNIAENLSTKYLSDYIWFKIGDVDLIRRNMPVFSTINGYEWEIALPKQLIELAQWADPQTIENIIKWYQDVVSSIKKGQRLWTYSISADADIQTSFNAYINDMSVIQEATIDWIRVTDLLSWAPSADAIKLIQDNLRREFADANIWETVIAALWGNQQQLSAIEDIVSRQSAIELIDKTPDSMFYQQKIKKTPTYKQSNEIVQEIDEQIQSINNPCN